MAVSSDILTRRLRITPFAERHLTETYVSWLNNPVLMHHSEQRHVHHSLESCRLYWRGFEGTPNYFWAIEETENGWGHIGNVNAFVSTFNRIADMGLLIGDPRAAGKHYGLEAWVGVCGFLFQTLHLRKVTGGCMADNVPMMKIMRRIGMVDDGVRRRQYLEGDREVDVVHTALFKDDWDSKVARRDELIRTCLGSDPV